MVEPWLKCSAPECEEFGIYVFRRQNAAGEEVSKRACRDHRDRGEAWLAQGAHQGAADAAAPPPVQGSML